MTPRATSAISQQPTATHRSAHHDERNTFTMSTESESHRVGLVSNYLQPLQEDEQEVPEDTEIPKVAQQHLSPPPFAACATTASSGSSSSGRRRFSAPRLRATISNGSRSPLPPNAAAAAACLPKDDNLYASLLRYQEEHDDSTTVSMGETLRSVSTWYSVQSDDDRKIPARPPLEDGGAFRRPYRAISRNTNTAAVAASSPAGPNFSSSSSSNSSSTAGAHGNRGARYPPPMAATRRTSSGSMSRSVASGPPPVLWEEEKDDYTAISSLANQTLDRSDEGSFLNSLPRYPLGVLDEGCAVGNSGTTTSSNNNNNNKDFHCLSTAAQLTQESSMGNMVETTRSAPTPFASDSGSGREWEWKFPNNLGDDEEGHRPTPSINSGRSNTSSPPQSTTPSPPPPAIPMNDFTRMQQTLGMQDLCVPGSTNHSVTGSVQSQPSAASSLRRNLSQAATVDSSSAAGNHSSEDPTADEQYRIWKQIQEEQERKQMELALQLSQEQASSRDVEHSSEFEYPDQNAKPPGADDGELDEEEALKVALRLSEEEAAASEAAWRHGGNASGGNGSDEEDEIALALRLSKEQAEADQKRFEQMQQDELSEEEQLRLAMEQSMANSSQRRGNAGVSASSLPQHGGRTDDEDDDNDEEMRRALAESLQRSERTESTEDGNDDDDDDMALALRLSQAQMEEEERFRKTFMRSSSAEAEEDRGMGSDSFSNMIQGFPGQHSSRRAQPGLEDGDFEPPVRSRPSQEPPSPGLPPPGQMSSSPSRGWGRRTGGAPPSIHHDLESPSQHAARDTFSQQQKPPSDEGERVLAREQSPQFRGPQHNKTPSKVHRPDDGDDMRPVSRPQRKDQKPTTTPGAKHCSNEKQLSNVVDIDKDSRDVLVREGQCETRAAILQGQSQIVTCRGCFGKLHAPLNCSLVFCPTCNTVSQVTGTDR